MITFKLRFDYFFPALVSVITEGENVSHHGLVCNSWMAPRESRPGNMLHRNPFQFSRNAQSWQCWHFCICFNFENQMDIVTNYLNFNLRHHDRCQVPLKFIPLVITSNLLSLEIVQKCQHCQLCVLQENSIECGRVSPHKLWYHYHCSPHLHHNHNAIVYC